MHAFQRLLLKALCFIVALSLSVNIHLSSTLANPVQQPSIDKPIATVLISPILPEQIPPQSFFKTSSSSHSRSTQLRLAQLTPQLEPNGILSVLMPTTGYGDDCWLEVVFLDQGEKSQIAYRSSAACPDLPSKLELIGHLSEAEIAELNKVLSSPAYQKYNGLRFFTTVPEEALQTPALTFVSQNTMIQFAGGLPIDDGSVHPEPQILKAIAQPNQYLSYSTSSTSCFLQESPRGWLIFVKYHTADDFSRHDPSGLRVGCQDNYP